MADQDDARRIARELPGVSQASTGFALTVEIKGKAKGFAWVWQERVHPKKPRVPQPEVLAVRVADLTERASLIAGDPDKFFTEPHYHGFPAVLVRLPSVTAAELRQVLVEGWRCMAPKALVAAYDAGEVGPTAGSGAAVETRRPRSKHSPARAGGASGSKRAAAPASAPGSQRAAAPGSQRAAAPALSSGSQRAASASSFGSERAASSRSKRAAAPASAPGSQHAALSASRGSRR